jgi:hypothetical protein
MLRLPAPLCLPLFASLLLGAPAAAQESLPLTGLPADDAVVNAIYAIPDEQLEVMQHLDELVNGIGPRLTSSRNLTEACEWAADRFRDWGLENVRLVEWGTFPVGFDRVHRRGRMLAPRKLELDFTTNAWTSGTAGPVRGPAVICPLNDEELTEVRHRLPGAWLLVPASGGPIFAKDGDGFRERLGRECDAARIAGQVRPSRTEELVHTGGQYQIDPEHLPSRVTISVRRDQFGGLMKRAMAGEEVALEFDIAQTFTPGPIPLYDVIAEIPGTDKANEMVIFGGHIDSWDGARGAQDNGTGTATTLEAARILSQTLAEQGLRPRRTIRFMLWSGEEQGLLGSRAYAEQHPEELPFISAVVVHDGGTNACAGIEASPAMRPMFAEVFAPMISHTADAVDEDLRFRIAEVDQITFPIGSDHDTYIPLGVPGFFWQQHGKTSYGYIHHTQHDLYGEANPEYQRFTSRVVAATAWRLANAETMVPRSDLPGRGEGRMPRRRLGIQPGEDGATIAAVTDGGMAASAGMKVGDKILKIGEREVKDMQTLFESLNAEGDRKMVVWQRGGEKFAAWLDWEKKTAEAAPVPN